jgi:predicted aconitase
MQPVESLKTFIKTNNLTEIWRKSNQDKQQFTWRRKDKTQASRIDMICIGTDLCSLVETCKIKPVTIQSTDHQSVYINCIPGVSEKGRRYWKINNTIEYQLLINNLIDKYIYDKVNNNVDCRL